MPGGRTVAGEGGDHTDSGAGGSGVVAGHQGGGGARGGAYPQPEVHGMVRWYPPPRTITLQSGEISCSILLLCGTDSLPVAGT